MSQDLTIEADRLGALINGHPQNLPAVLPKLLELLTVVNQPATLAAVIDALGHAWDQRAALATLAYATHRDDQVRLAVARAAAGGVETPAAQEAVASVLIALTRDPVREIRDWATFGLGSILDLDSPAIREALADRLSDEDDDTSHEALVALAERHDERAFPATLDRLTSESVGRLAIDAVRILADRRLLPALEALQDWWDVDLELLHEAIGLCSGEESGAEERSARGVPEIRWSDPG